MKTKYSSERNPFNLVKSIVVKVGGLNYAAGSRPFCCNCHQIAVKMCADFMKYEQKEKFSLYVVFRLFDICLLSMYSNLDDIILRLSYQFLPNFRFALHLLTVLDNTRPLK